MMPFRLALFRNEGADREFCSTVKRGRGVISGVKDIRLSHSELATMITTEFIVGVRIVRRKRSERKVNGYVKEVDCYRILERRANMINSTAFRHWNP